MGRQHLAVGVDVDPLALGLLQQHLEVLEVVTRDHDGLALDRRDAHRGGDGVTVGRGVGPVEQLHGQQVELTHLEGHGHGLVDTVLLGDEVERLVHEGVERRIGLAQHLGVVSVGREALEPVGDQLLQAEQVLV